MEKFAQKNGCFFICFVTFTSTLVYSVIWNQSMLTTNDPFGSTKTIIPEFSIV